MSDTASTPLLQPIVVQAAFTADELVEGFNAYASDEIERFGRDLGESASTDDLVSLVAGLASGVTQSELDTLIAVLAEEKKSRAGDEPGEAAPSADAA
jgi:hypothetical protein